MRQEQMKTLLEERGLDAGLVARPANIRYLSGFVGTESYLYVSRTRGVILTDSRYTLQAQEEGKGCEVRTIGKGRGYGALLAELIREDQVRELGFEEDALLYGTVCGLQKESGLAPEHWKALEDSVSAFRAVKSEDELQKMERAEQIGDEAFSYILNELRPGLTELQVLDLTGCSLTNVLYYPDREIPVLALLEDGNAVLITGFNERNVVLMDPPRAGSDEAFLSSLVTLAPERVIYISCNPVTLARDLRYLGKHGYRVRKAVPVDMFPWTASEHVETVALLSRKHPQ